MQLQNGTGLLFIFSGADIGDVGIGVILLADGLLGDGAGGGADHPDPVQLRVHLHPHPLAGTGLVTLDRALLAATSV